MTTIGIIGGGACGISAFIELFLQLRIASCHLNTRITIIEEKPDVGRGIAFGTKEPGHILNTQADLMGIHFAEPAHFSEWLIRHQRKVSGEVVDNQGQDEAFTTRRLYGDYLKEQFDHYFQLAGREGMKVNVLQKTALNVGKKGDQFVVELTSEESFICDFLILAPGTPVANTYPELDDHPHYFESPWLSKSILETIPKKADVAILGASLSAVDALMTLTDHNYTGKFRCYALDGLMPRVQPDKQEMVERQFITLANLHEIQRSKLRNPTVKEILRLFMKEAEAYAGKAIDWRMVGRQNISAQQRLDEDIAIAMDGGDALINIPYSLRYDSSEMWKWLDEDEKLRFKKWLGRYWAINRHCMPLYNAKRVADLFHNDRLEVIGGLEDIRYDVETNRFVMHCEDGQKHAEGYLINATGPASHVKEMKSQLIRNLAAGGQIEPDPVGGIKIDTETMQVIAGDACRTNLYAVGHITNGALLDVNAVWFNVKMIGKLCNHLTAQLIGKAS